MKNKQYLDLMYYTSRNDYDTFTRMLDELGGNTNGNKFFLCKNYKWDKYCWWKISIEQGLSEKFIRIFHNDVDWFWISCGQKLSESFIEEFQDKVDWTMVSMHQKLSENFIRKHQDNVDWWRIFEYQNLSMDFIREFKDKVDWNIISRVYDIKGTVF